MTEENPSAAVWKSAEEALVAGDASTLQLLLQQNERLFRERQAPPFGPEPGRLAPDYSGGDAKSIILRNHLFERWVDFVDYTDALKRENSPIARFEQAVDAVIIGDITILEHLLRKDMELIHARSMRKHHATLLHYVGANGIEDFRQRTPNNAVQVAATLLDAGAEVDAKADMYGGGCTTLNLVATSIHPHLVGVQNSLLQLLLERGARIDGPGTINSCLANGRVEAAEFLVRYGAPLDLEGAAGVGRLDLVKSFFNEDGSLKSNVTQAQLKDAFAWACKYGRTSVVDLLLTKGIDVDVRLRHYGQTGLHWAAAGAHVETVKLLLKLNASVHVKDESFGGSPLSWALYSYSERPSATRRDHYYTVVALLVAAGAKVTPESVARNKVSGDHLMLAALRGEMHRE